VTAIFDFVLRTSPYVIGLGLITSALMLAAVAWFHDEGCRCERCRRRER
jgi:hypothetical protein